MPPVLTGQKNYEEDAAKKARKKRAADRLRTPSPEALEGRMTRKAKREGKPLIFT